MTRQGRDRLRALVEREYQTNHVAGIEWIESSLKLLRAEHRRVVTLIKKEMDIPRNDPFHKSDVTYRAGYRHACDDILAALAKRRGGKP